MNEPTLVAPSRRHHDYLIPADAPPLMPRIIRENLSIHRKTIRHATFRKQCRALAKIHWARFDDPFREAAARLFAVLECTSDIPFEFGLEELRIETFIRMVEYRDYWIQPPEEWRVAPGKCATQQVFSLIKHLFVAYPVPDFFRKAWMQPGALRSHARDWFCQLAAGKNLRALKSLPTTLTKQAAHCAMAAPATLTIEQALRYGQVIAFGGCDQLARDIINTRAGTDFDRDHVWLKVIEKIAREPRFAPWEAGIVIDFIYHWIIENNGRSPAGMLKDNHILEITKRARIFWKETAERAAIAYESRSLAEFGFQWVRNRLLKGLTNDWHPLEDVKPAVLTNQDGDKWHIDELCTELELQREGGYMRHCIALYSPYCNRGTSSVWQVTSSDPNHRATLRLYTPDLELCEARARFNRVPSDETLSAIRLWARSNGIDDSWLDREYVFKHRPLELIQEMA